MTEEAEVVETPEAEAPVVEIKSAAELYDGAEPVEAKEPETAAEEEEAKEPEAEPETDTKEEEAMSAPTPEEQIAALQKEVSGLKGAYGAEKDKRQEAEAKVERPDPIDDPEGFAKSIEDTSAQNNAQEIGDIKHTLFTNDLLSRHEDGKEVLAKFEELIVEKPWLLTEAINIRDKTGQNPYQLSYDIYKRETTKETPLNVEELTAKITKDLEAKYAKADKKAKVDEVKENIPEDLSGEASRGTRAKAAYKSPSANKLYN